MPLNKHLLADLAKIMPKATAAAKKRAPSEARISKRHWFLSSAIIVGCSWITHTTTANIDQEPLAGFYQKSFADVYQKQSLGFTTQPTSLTNSVTSEPKALNTVVADLDLKRHKTLIPTPPFRSKTHTIMRGESLGIIFRKKGLDLAIPHHISKHPIAKQLTSIQVGKTIDFKFDVNDALREISYPLTSLQRLDVRLDKTKVASAEIIDIQFNKKQRTVSAEIKSSLYLAAQNVSLSSNLIMEMVRIFGWDVDFVQDIRAGDDFHIVFDEYFNDGEKLADGNILAAEFTTQGHTYRAIRFEDQEGIASYFNPKGESMLGTFLRSPVEFSRISSRFGKRKHPISKKWKAHKGVDYAASRGTPIRATADGKIVHVGRKGGYGKTVVIRHAGRFSTLYAHMNGYAKGIKNGTRIKQGQTIGYVGSTGMSTGPHLHYEFRVNGVHRNSLTYKTPKASAVSKANFNRFTVLSDGFERTLDTVKQEYELAKASKSKRSKKI